MSELNTSMNYGMYDIESVARFVKLLQGKTISQFRATCKNEERDRAAALDIMANVLGKLRENKYESR